jgi:hypothetical protein
MMKSGAHWLLFVALAIFGAGCATANKRLFPAAAGAPRKTIHVVNHGWHAGLIVARADIPTNLWHAQRAFAPFEFVEVSWGEEVSCRSERITVSIGLKAVIGPSPSVLRMIGFNAPVALNSSTGELVRVEVSEEGFARLCEFIDDEFARDSRGGPILLGPGLDGASRLYRAHCGYYFPRSCNTWIAAALRSAGCPVAEVCSVTAGCLMLQLRRFGTIVSRYGVSVRKDR